MRRLSLRLVLFVFAGAFAALPVIALGFALAWRAEERELRRSDVDTSAVSRAVARDLSLWLTVNVEATEALAAHVASRGDFDEAVLAELIRIQLAHAPGLYSCYVADVHGRTIASVPAQTAEGRSLIGVDYSEREYFKRLFQTHATVVSDVLTSASTQRPAVVLAAPARNGAGTIVAYAACGLDLERVSSTVEGGEGGLETTTVILDRLGRPLVHPNRELRKQAGALAGLPLYELLPRAGAEHRVDFDERGRLVRATAEGVNVRGTPWLVVVSRTEAAVLADAQRLRQDVMVGAAIALLCSLVVSALLSMWLVQPIAALERNLSAIAAGDLTVEPARPSPWLPREIATVVDASRLMLGFLRAHIAELVGVIDRVADASRDIDVASRKVARESDRAWRSVDVSRSSIDDIGAAIARVDGSVDHIRQSADDAAASATAMELTSRLVATRADEMARGVGDTVTSVRDTQRSVQEVARRAGAVSAVATATFAAVQDLDRLLREVGGMTNDASAIAKEVSLNAESGGSAVQATVRGIHRIREAATSVGDAIALLEQHMQQIHTVVDVIHAVAEETRLLSLNASIIAAQARGKGGHGFAVVANEVNALARRVSESTMKIATLIGHVQTSAADAAGAMAAGAESVTDGVRLGLEASQSLERIQGSAARVMQRIAGIVLATERQRVQSEHVTQALHRITENTQEIATLTAAQAANGTALLETAEAMRHATTAVATSTAEQAAGVGTILGAAGQVQGRLADLDASRTSLTQERGRVAKSMAELADVAAEQNQAVAQLGPTVALLSAQADVLRRAVHRFRTDERGADERRVTDEA